MASAASSKGLLLSRVVWGVTGAASLGASAWLFRDLADISQWVLKADRHDVFETFRLRHELATLSLSSLAVNLAVSRKARVPLPAVAAVNGVSLFLLFSGYVNPEIMMRPRNQHAVYVPASDALKYMKKNESVIVTRIRDDGPHYAFPDSQVLRPHVARIGTTSWGIPVVMTYCGLTNLGIAYETPVHEDGSEVELVPLTQLENNLVLMDKSTGHIGQQINGLDETSLLQKIGKDSYHETKRRPSTTLLKEIKLHESEVGRELPTWRMSLGNFVRTYPEGQVFINDYKMLKDYKQPIKTLYDSMMDIIFETSVHFQATDPRPVFPTLENIDPRLPPKEQVWAFNVGDDYVAVTEGFVRDAPSGLRNMTVGGEPIVAAWDAESGSLGIWRRASAKPIWKPIDVHGRVNGKGEPLERLNTVKNGAFWCVWSTFFPQTRVNPLE